MHYSVTESAGTLIVTIVKKKANMDCTVGVRTVDETAKAGKEFDAMDEPISFTKKESEKTVAI